MSILAVSGPWALLVAAACMLPSRIPSGKPFASFTVCWTCWGLKHLDSQCILGSAVPGCWACMQPMQKMRQSAGLLSG